MKPDEMHAADSSGGSKILWLSIVQGWAILLVVVGHVNGYTYSGVDGELYPLSGMIHDFCYAFHMPLFMFVSGGLLYYSRIGRGWKTGALYRDKLKRLLLPYVFFTALTFVLKGALSSHMKRGVDVSLHGFVNAFFDPANGPLVEMWFIGTLMWLMLFYPLYRQALRWQWAELLLLAATLAPLVLSLHLRVGGWLSVSGVPAYAFYFTGGMLFFKYRLYRWFEGRWWAAMALTALFLALLAAGWGRGVVQASCGILMSVGWGVVAAGRWPGVFASFRDHTFQIFLVGLFPQMFVELFVWTKIHHQWLQLPFYVVSCLGAIVVGVVVSRLMSRVGSKWLRWCFGLK